ncbi:hypothetical protein NC651_015397 [Populus alba x Populus x berolinensis]|nr:hypothetical protein NC651_015397 [Populus alba x Populus x berolinensis]
MLVRFNPKTDLHVKVIVKYDLRLSRANITFSGLFAFPAFTSGLFCHILSVFPLLFSMQRFQEEAVPGARQRCTNNNKSRCQFLQFNLQELKSATANFRPDSNILREGGLGYVFKGWIGENGTSPAN